MARCSHARSPTRSSASTPAASRSRRTSRAASRLHDRRARRPRVPGGEAPRAQRDRARPSSSGRCGGSRSTSRRRRCARRARRSTCRSRSRSSPPRGRSRPTRSPSTRRSASSRSTGGCGPVGGVLARRRGGARAPGLPRLALRRRSRPRPRSPGSSRCPCGISPRRSRTCAASATRSPVAAERPSSRGARARPRRRARPGAGAARARDRRGRAATTCCSRARRAPARRCSRAGCRDPAAALARRGARGDAHPLRRRAARPRTGRSSRRARSARRTTARRSRRSSAAGPGPRPGEVSLAHRGVLLLDELAEFQRPALEALRQPLEDGVVSIARAGGRAVLPGALPARRDDEPLPVRRARRSGGRVPCSPQRLRFRDKLSRALLDRFDLVVHVPRPRARELAAPPARPPSRCGERVGCGARAARQARAARGRGGDELSTEPSSDCPSRGAGVRGSRGSRRRRRARRRGRRSAPSTSPRRSPTARRRSSAA